MSQFLPLDPLIRSGVLLVLLTPCIDYVVTFAHLGRADARLPLAGTPALAVENALPVLPAIIVAQTLVELVSELVYVRAIPRMIKAAAA